MKTAWWLHRILIVGLTGLGFLAGAYFGLHLVSHISRLPGINIPEFLQFALYPLCAIAVAAIPQTIFRKWIHASCPVDGQAMVKERIRIYPEGDRRVGRSVSRYRCEKCGLTK